MNRFRPGIGMLLAGTGVPVVPCHLSGCFEAWPPKAKIARPKAVRLRIGPPLTFAGSVQERAGWESISSALENAVRVLGPEKAP